MSMSVKKKEEKNSGCQSVSQKNAYFAKEMNSESLWLWYFLSPKSCTAHPKDKHRGPFGLKMTLTTTHSRTPKNIRSEFDLGYPSGRKIIDNLASKWQVLLKCLLSEAYDLERHSGNSFANFLCHLSTLLHIWDVGRKVRSQWLSIKTSISIYSPLSS